jgi:2-haloacid dehalogenase
MIQLDDIRACVFDAYGTLFDVHSAIARHRDRVPGDADAISRMWRDKQLQYTWLRSLMGRHADFRTVTADALDYALDSHGIDDTGLRESLLEAYFTLDAYPEVASVLDALKAGGKVTAILSNGSPDMLEAAVSGAGLQDRLDRVLSVEEVGIFKPDPRVYQLAVDRLGVEPRQISFQSSNAWDAVGAASFGFRVVWINRFGQRRERLGFEPDAEVTTLEPLPDLVGAG